jgi:hypothetical protein
VRAIHEHEFEESPGLPAPLPKNETVLWQGSPDWRSLAIHVFHLRKIAVYFALMLVLQLVHLYDAELPVSVWLMPCVTSFILAAAALACLAMWTWLSSRTTLYTITDRRVVMRIGIVLSLTFNLPFKRITAADLRLLDDQCGDISLKLPEQDKIGFFHLWPHARGLNLKHPQPCMRCVPKAQTVGELLMSSWSRQGVAYSVTPAPQQVSPAMPLRLNA